MEPVLDYHLLLDRGKVRERNEDRCGAFVPEDEPLLRERGYLFVVADGMGGHAAGDVAAEETLKVVSEQYFQGDWPGAAPKLREAFLAANAAILDAGAADPRMQGMGAAAVAVAIIGDRATVGHLGDARVYLFRGPETLHLTRDHSWVQQRMDEGRLTDEDARVHPYRNVLTRALGAEADAEPDVVDLALAPGDVIVLCSDGLWSLADDSELARTVGRAKTAQETAEALMRLAIGGGGTDNIAVIVIRVRGAVSSTAPTVQTRLPHG